MRRWSRAALLACALSSALVGARFLPSAQGAAPQVTPTAGPLPEAPPDSPARHGVLDATTAPAAPSPLRAPALPPGLLLGRPTELSVAGDRSLRVVHAPAENTQAIVYLHGMCGNPEGADAWAAEATRYGTLVTVRADVPCPDRPGYKWPTDVSEIESRISVALAAVRSARGGRLDLADVALFGYSQGAHRAERLAAAAPHRYRRVVLGGPPTSPTPERLRHTRAVAVLGGELEDTTHMVDGYLDLASAGVRAEFFLLPRAAHGGYGPDGKRVVAAVFEFLLADEN